MTSAPLDYRPPPSQLDWRLQLYNDGLVGPITHVQSPLEAITRLHGVMYDIDPALLRPDVVPPGVLSTPQALYDGLVRPWLQRHPALAGAEVVNSGGGLHVIVRFDRPVEFRREGERRRWAGIIKAVQAVLPTDPDAPGITAVTRPIGSTNGKNGAVVTLLDPGRPVPVAEVLALYDQLRSRPFTTVAGVLFGSDRVSPCPNCRKPGTTLAAFDRVGQCYGACGKVQLGRLHDAYLVPRAATSTAAEGVRHGGGPHVPA